MLLSCITVFYVCFWLRISYSDQFPSGIIHPSTFSNYSSEATSPVFIKFHMKPPLVRGTKMAAMPIYGNKLRKSSSIKMFWC